MSRGSILLAAMALALVQVLPNSARAADGITRTYGSLDQGTRDESLDKSLGFPICILGNFVHKQAGIRHMFVLLAAEHFNARDLTAVASHLGTEFPQPNEIAITIFSDRAMLRRAIALQRVPGAVAPDARLSSEQQAEVYPSPTGYFRAYYRRYADSRVSLVYGPDPQKGRYVKIPLSQGAQEPHGGDARPDLLAAARSDDIAEGAYLLANGADPNANNSRHENPLMIAAERGDTDFMQLVISAGASLESTDEDGRTPLLRAIAADQWEAAAALLDAGADVSARSARGETALHIACSNHRGKHVKLLLDRGADPNAASETGQTPIMVAARIGDEEAVEMLTTAGANVNAKDQYGRTALMLACADANHLDLPSAMSPHSLDIVTLLLRSGACINQQDTDGLTAVMYAVMRGALPEVKLLIQRGADPTIKTKAGKSALFLADERGFVEIAMFLRGATAPKVTN